MKFATLFLLLFLPFSAFSYNYVGHIVIAETAYKMLSEEQQGKLDRYAQALKKEGNLVSTFGRFKGISNFARAAYVPGTTGDATVEALFSGFNLDVPEALKPESGSTTSEWHYIDYPLNATSCKSVFINKVNVETSYKNMTAAYKSAGDDTSKALTLAYIAHLVGDAHSPVSTSSINIGEEGECAKDRGGLKFCIVKHREDGLCPKGKNLNRFWENSAYAVDDIKQLRKYIRKVENAVRDLDQASLSTKISDWTMESHQLASFVYSTPEGEWPSRKYEADAEDLSIKQMAKAAVRLKLILEQLAKDSA